MSTVTKENTQTLSTLDLVGRTNMTTEPERSNYSVNDKDLHKKKQERHENRKDDSKLLIGEEMGSVRYFIIKSLNYENIRLSYEKGIWATQLMNEPILEEAFNSSPKVILIFSVNSSGFFNGYAQMMSSVGQRRDRVWSQGAAANNPWGRSFKVKWLRLSNLPFYKTFHLKNPLNEYKPVKISRDCQELPTEIGEALCDLIDSELDEDPNMTRHDLDPGCSFPEDTCNASPNSMAWGSTYMFHQSFPYQYHSEASRWHSAPHGVSPSEYMPIMANKRAMSKHPKSKGHVLDLPVNSKESYQTDSSRLLGEMSPLCYSLTEEEFLEMSYEEYVDAYDRRTNQLRLHAGSQLQKKEGSSSKDIDSEDLYSNSDRVSSHKTSHH